MAVDPPAVSRREEKAHRTRLAIQRAAAELTLELGYDEATLDRIAARAGVSRRTVFSYFDAKDDILLSWTPARVERGVRHLQEGQGSAVDRLRAWFETEAERGGLDADAKVWIIAARAIASVAALRARETELHAPVRAALAACVAEDLGLPADHEGPQTFAAAALAALQDLSHRAVTGRLAPDKVNGVALRVFLAAGLAGLREEYGSRP